MNRLIVTKVFIENPKDISQIRQRVLLSAKDLRMDPHNGSHVSNNKGLKENTLGLFWNGCVFTPAFQFASGRYQLEFIASGTIANNRYPVLKVEVEFLSRANYFIPEVIKYVYLRREMTAYKVDFLSEEEGIGRIKLSFVNDESILEKREDRNVWLKDLRIGPAGSR